MNPRTYLRYETLSPGETRVFTRLVLGESNAQIGRAIHLSEQSVKFHVTRIFRKCQTKSRARLIALYYLNKLPEGILTTRIGQVIRP